MKTELPAVIQLYVISRTTNRQT